MATSMDADDAASVKVVHDIAAAHPKTGVYVMADTVVHDGEDADGIDRRRIERGDIRVLDEHSSQIMRLSVPVMRS